MDTALMVPRHFGSQINKNLANSLDNKKAVIEGKQGQAW